MKSEHKQYLKEAADLINQTYQEMIGGITNETDREISLLISKLIDITDYLYDVADN